MDNLDELLKSAKMAIKNSYSPYSMFRVAASLRTSSGAIYVGVNIENSSYGLTVCAERVAIFKAVSEGETDLKELLIYTETDEPVPPCGACLQVMAEFNPDMKVYLAYRKGVEEHSLKDLLPRQFRLYRQHRNSLLREKHPP